MSDKKPLGSKYIRTQNYRDYPLECDRVKFSYGAYGSYHRGCRRFINFKWRDQMAAIHSGSASVDALWAELDEEEVSFKFEDGEKLVKLRKPKENKYPFGKSVSKRSSTVDVSKLDDDELEKFAYSSTKRYYDINKSIALQKATGVPGLGVIKSFSSRDKFFDFLFIVSENALSKDEIATVLNCDIELIDMFMYTGACLGMCFSWEGLADSMRERNPDGSMKAKVVLTIGSWGIIDKNVLIRGSRSYGMTGVNTENAKLPVQPAKRAAMLEEIGKFSTGARSKIDEAFKFNMDELGSDRNAFRRFESTGKRKARQGLIGGDTKKPS